MKLSAIAACAALLCATSALAQDYVVGPITVHDPQAFETAKSASTGGGFLSVTNAGAVPDALISVSTPDIPKSELHISETDANGVARMRHLDAIAIPPGETVTLAPGGLHVMFMGLSAPLTSGDTIDATLEFEKAGRIDVIFNVVPRRAAAHGAMNHATHDTSD